MPFSSLVVTFSLLVVVCMYNLQVANTQSNYAGQRYMIITRCHKEKPYFDAFVHWHLNLGFEHILIIQNDLEQHYIPNRKLYNKRVRIINDVAPVNDVMNRYLGYLYIHDFDWVLAIDIDEFLILDTTRFKTIGQYAQSVFDNHGSVDAILFRWVSFQNLDFNCFNGTLPQLFDHLASFESFLFKTMTRISRIVRFDSSHRTDLKNNTRLANIYFEETIHHQYPAYPLLKVKGMEDKTLQHRDYMLMHIETRSIADLVTKALTSKWDKRKLEHGDKLMNTLTGAKALNFERFTKIFEFKARAPFEHSGVTLDLRHLSSGISAIAMKDTANHSGKRKHKNNMNSSIVIEPLVGLCDRELEYDQFVQILCSFYYAHLDHDRSANTDSSNSIDSVIDWHNITHDGLLYGTYYNVSSSDSKCLHLARTFENATLVIKAEYIARKPFHRDRGN